MRKALIVGIDDYPNCPLHGCCNDAESMQELLTSNESGDPNFEVRKKCNVRTKAELRQLVEECFAGDTINCKSV